MVKHVLILLFSCCALWLTACSPSTSIAGTARKNVLRNPAFQSAHVGISIFDATQNRNLYNYQADKYFVPASNAKIFTLYAGMKYLQDSLEGMRYEQTKDTFFVYPTADPTLLHPGFRKQPVIEVLQKTRLPLVVINNAWNDEALGPGWSWDDYNDPYMTERSALPVYGHVIHWTQVSQRNTQPELQDSMQTFVFSEPEVNWKVRFLEDTANRTFMVKRKKDENYFEISQGREIFREQSVPFVTNGIASAVELLKDTIGMEIIVQNTRVNREYRSIYSQPADSVFKPMLYRSDNFFAEQILLMAAYNRLGVMNGSQLIENLLSTDLKELPQKPRWVDGSGLSRYNLFTPVDFVWMLNKLRTEFGMDRMKALLPGGGQGTLSGYFQQDSGYIYAKTGSMSGQVALSGFMITPKSRLLIFSVLVNNHQSSATAIRRAVEKFLVDVRRRN